MTPRLDESLKLFEEICHNQFFLKIPIILLFNKEDLFRKKIEKVDLKVWDQNYDGGFNFENAFQFISKKFLSKDPVPNRKISVFICTSTDTDIVNDVFDKVNSSVYSS
jgi:guanine nucleotide-binding protein G(i) subunit alpha